MRFGPDRRERMIHETSAFLTWALSSGAHLPRIPVRKVDDGGFDWMLRVPGAREAVTRWWLRAMDVIDRYGH